MSCARRDPAEVSVPNEVAAVLRHDLVTPINLIVGYCDLMIGEASDLGHVEPLAPLRSIRGYGFVLLNLIDRSLLDDRPDRSVVDIQGLGDSLSGPATSLLEACDTLAASFSRDASTTEFDEDLQKVRSAGAQMITMADHLAAGNFPDGIKARTLFLD